MYTVPHYLRHYPSQFLLHESDGKLRPWESCSKREWQTIFYSSTLEYSHDVIK
jgi:hypothetical protein